MLGKDVDTYTYAVRSIKINGKIQIECNLGHYFSQESQFKNFYITLPLRLRPHEKVANPVLDGTQQSPAIEISMLIA